MFDGSPGEAQGGSFGFGSLGQEWEAKAEVVTVSLVSVGLNGKVPSCLGQGSIRPQGPGMGSRGGRPQGSVGHGMA